MNTLKKMGTFLYGSICGTLFGIVLGLAGLVTTYSYGTELAKKSIREKRKYRYSDVKYSEGEV